MRRVKKIHTATIGMLCFITLTAGACVSRSTYDSATANLGTTKAELDKFRTEAQGLTQQVNVYQERQVDLARQKEVASAALQQATKKIKAEHAETQKRLSELTRTIQQLTAQQKSLRYEVTRATKEQPRLQSAIEILKSKHDEADRLNASAVPSPAEPISEPAQIALVPQAQIPVAQAPAPQPTVVPTAAPVSLPMAAAPKPPSPRIQPTEPVEEDWWTYLENWISSLWQSVAFI
ncbi:MAG: hypothetical protein ABI988_16370 [Nitrospirota bacterium]